MTALPMRLAYAAIYVAAVVAANRLTERFGLVPIGFGLVVAAGTFAAAAALLVRNLGQDVLGRRVIVALMVFGAVLSWWLSTPALAIASAVAFALSEVTDMLVYTHLRNPPAPEVTVFTVGLRGKLRKRRRLRGSREWALLLAGAAGAAVDTLFFLHLAGFPITAASVGGQLLVKAGLSAAVAATAGALEVRRALLRQSVNPAGA